MQRREFLKNAASTVIAGSLGATAARADTGEVRMSKVQANGITINYEQQGAGEPLVLIPYLAADHACYAFQVADYAKHFTCISLDPRGAGETDKPDGTYSMELFADDVAAFMQAIGIERAHVSGLSLGAATGLGLPANIRSGSSRYRYTVAGPRAMHFSRPWREVGRAPLRD
jgi:pimeloyl-ACP methyl ester carboxylesterase